MGTTTPYGYKQPTNGDTDWWDQLTGNITRVDAHNHDGVNSSKLEAKNILKSTSTISDTEWGLDLGGSTFTKLMNMPSGHDFENSVIMVYDTDSGEQIYPTITRLTASTYNLTVNDNTLNLRVVYA